MVDWQELFTLSLPAAEIVVRGTSIYWFLFGVFRFVLRRDVGAIGLADILVLVIIADASQNAMAGDYKTIADGFVLVSTIVFWNLLLDWLSFHFPRLRRLVEPGVLLLVKDGEIMKRTLRREFLTEAELMSQLREKGIDKLAQVKRAYMESHGGISVIKQPEPSESEQDSKPRRGTFGR
jgi:uncharacterized membrane protein YcaP (DUF421 family)